MASKKLNSEQLLAELESIRTSGTIQQISRIIEILQASSDLEVRNTAVTLLADIKNPKMVEIMMQELEHEGNASSKKELTRACWESGLNYGAHLSFFTKTFIEADYETSLEAFTLIENTLLDFDIDKMLTNSLADRVKAVVLDLPEHKQNLALELIHLLKEN